MPIQPNFLERTAFNLNLVPGVMLDLGGALAFQALYLAAQLEVFQVLADGRVYTHDDIQSWLQHTGFGEAQFHRISKVPGTSLMVARKA